MGAFLDVGAWEKLIDEMSIEEKLSAWADIHHICQVLEASIKYVVVTLGESVATDCASARFFSGRTEYDYVGIARELGLTPEELAPFTSMVVDYRSACLERGIPNEMLARHSRMGSPYVVLKHE